MRNLILEIFSRVNYSLANQEEVLEPIMYKQPYIEYRSSHIEPVPETSLENSNNQLVSTLDLKFTIDYRNYLTRFTPLQITVTLKKYKEKANSKEKYVSALHEPQVVTLPQEECHHRGVSLNISREMVPNHTTGEGEATLDVFSFKTSKHVYLDTILKSEEVSDEFCDFMMGDDRTACSKYAFQFFVEILFYKNNKPPATHTITISSYVFQYEHRYYTGELFISEVDSDNYHLGIANDAHDSQGRCGKFIDTIKRKLGIK